MSLSAVSHAPALDLRSSAPTLESSRATLRLLLLSGCAAAVALAAWIGEPGGALRADAELAFLLRGMASIKAAIVLAAVAVLWWRFGHFMSQRMATAYLVGAWSIAGATMLVWQLSFIPFAALVFHAGEFTLLFAAWRDHRSGRAASA